jgi:hypothetical protein
MANGLLFVYSEPGPVPEAEFNDWYDNEHVPARLSVPGFSNVCRFRAADGQVPSWLATYDIAPGTLDSPRYKALAKTASAREKSIMSQAALERRVYEPLSDSAPGASFVPSVVHAVSLSVPPSVEDDLAAWYDQEHVAMLLAVPGWRRVRRYRLTAGTAPAFLALHDVESTAVFGDPAFLAAVSTPWRNRIAESVTAQERRVFALHAAFGA